MKPLLHDEGLTDTERALLHSARDDGPSPELHARTLAALGLGVSAGAAVLSSTVAAKAGAAGAAGGAGALGTVGAAASGAASTITTLTIGKWLAAGALLGTVVTSGAVVVVDATSVADAPTRQTSAAHTPEHSGPVARTDLPASRTVPAGDTPSPHEGAQEPAPLRPVDDLPSTERAAAGAVAAPVRRAAELSHASANAGAEDPPSSAWASRLTAEVAALDQARSALAAGDAAAALAGLRDHSARFPGGALEPEAVVLRVRALLHLGRTAEARRAAEDFLARSPGSPQAARLRALIGPPSD